MVKSCELYAWNVSEALTRMSKLTRVGKLIRESHGSEHRDHAFPKQLSTPWMERWGGEKKDLNLPLSVFLHQATASARGSQSCSGTGTTPTH